MKKDPKAHDFTIGHLFCGVGGGAIGATQARARWSGHTARFRTVGGVDNESQSCSDFETLARAPATEADLHSMTPAALRASWGPRAPDVALLSPPCKGFSALLSAERAKDEKYVALNKLLLDGLFLLCSTWDEPPAIIFVENVPRITARGKPLLHQVREMLRAHGYAVTDDAYHNCGELGGLAQNRMRFFLVARCRRRIPQWVYQPPKQRVRACGEVIGPMPFPGDVDVGGPLHQLPKISWLNWVRLALIPAGGDWRDLRGVVPDGKQRRDIHRRHKVADYEKPIDTVVGPGNGGVSNVADPRFKDKTWWQHVLGVSRWEEPFPTVTGTTTVSSGPNQVADPIFDRFALGADNPGRHENKYSVTPWEEPARTVIGASRPGSGAPAIADPRPFDSGRMGVVHWDHPSKAVTGESLPSNGSASVADPRFHHCDKVVAWDKPVGTVTASPAPSSGGAAAADPRWRGAYKVNAWDEPSGCVTGRAGISTGPHSVQDARIPLGCKLRSGPYGVLRWDEAAATISGSMGIDNGRAAVADPRFPSASKPPLITPIIVSKDGTWHRPLTTLELAALQGFPTTVRGKPMTLAGDSSSRWREAIGNAIPPPAAEAIAEQLLLALLVSKLNGFVLSNQQVWVAPEQRDEEIL